MDPGGFQGERGTRGGQPQNLEPVLQRKKDLLYHTADGVEACKRKDEEKILQAQPHHITKIVLDGGVIQIARLDGAPGDRQSAIENTSQV